MNIEKNAEISFRKSYSALKAITGRTDSDMAELLGVSRQTLSKLMKNPLHGSSRNVLLIQEHLRQEERKRYV